MTNIEKNERAKSVIQYYLLCLKLKEVIRTGWINWNVKEGNTGRVESIAEHVFGVQAMAIGMYFNYDYKNVDLAKAILMLSIHETEETIIGDLTRFQISKEEKEKKGHEAVRFIFSQILSAPALEQLVYEFDERKTPEAKFCYQCDKIECDVQAKYYGDQGRVDLTKQQDNKTFYNGEVQELFKQGLNFGEMWVQFGQDHYDYDANFLEVSNYAMTHNLAEMAKSPRK